MPNWCNNVLMIQGEHDEVQKLLDLIEGDSSLISFDRIITQPEALKGTNAFSAYKELAEENKRLYGASDWYDWNLKNWGVKWDASNSQLIYDKVSAVQFSGLRTVKIAFDTPWNSPEPVIRALASQFPNTNIYLTFDEPGMDFGGWHMYSKGEEVKSGECESFWNLSQYMDPNEEVFQNFPDND